MYFVFIPVHRVIPVNSPPSSASSLCVSAVKILSNTHLPLYSFLFHIEIIPQPIDNNCLIFKL
jgi:hypothetical protein